MRRFPGRRALAILVPLAIVVGACLLWLLRDSIRSPEALYSEARTASGRRAEKLYGLLAERLPDIADYAQLWRAEAAMPDPSAFRTLQLLAEYRPNSPEAYLAYVAMARYYAEIDASSADDAYLAALTLNESLPLRLELARFYEERGENDAAYRQYRLLLPIKADAFAGMRRTAPNRLQLAEDLNTAGYFSDTLEVLREVEGSDALRLRTLAYLGLGKTDEAALELEAWLPTYHVSDEDQLGLAEALAQLGQTESAIATYALVDTPESQLAMTQLLETGSPDEAIRRYETLPYPVAWWNATWLLEAEGRIEEALPLYARVAASDAYFNDDAAYRLVVLGKRSANSAAVTQAKGYLAGFGLNWLAQRAGVMSPELPMGPSVEPQAPDVFSRVESLDRLGREDLADLELLFCARLLGQQPARLACLQALADRGYFREAEPIASEIVHGLARPPRELWQLAFPKPYAEAVLANANELGLDPLLIWSVIRVESRYDPNAASPAGARGLMQIIPATQDWIEGQLGLDLAPGEIFVPEVNIRLGAWYLRYLLDQFDGDLELAIPAYNAGPDNVHAWLQDPMVKDRDDFIRWIGFGETREYLERVSIAYWEYQQIYMP
jgi:soluble lytic murein transglycosylase